MAEAETWVLRFHRYRLTRSCYSLQSTFQGALHFIPQPGGLKNIQVAGLGGEPPAQILGITEGSRELKMLIPEVDGFLIVRQGRFEQMVQHGLVTAQA